VRLQWQRDEALRAQHEAAAALDTLHVHHIADGRIVASRLARYAGEVEDLRAKLKDAGRSKTAVAATIQPAKVDTTHETRVEPPLQGFREIADSVIGPPVDVRVIVSVT